MQSPCRHRKGWRRKARSALMTGEARLLAKATGISMRAHLASDNDLGTLGEPCASRRQRVRNDALGGEGCRMARAQRAKPRGCPSASLSCGERSRLQASTFGTRDGRRPEQLPKATQAP